MAKVRSCMASAYRNGWTLVSDKTHFKLRCPHGCCQVTCSRSCSDGVRGEMKALADFRRCPHWQREKETRQDR